MAALNISGSYEGALGWGNVTDNFDGQGLSLGLLNQTLGQGSLQPLLTQMLTQFPTLSQQILGQAKFNSIYQMLERWNFRRGVVLGISGSIRDPLDYSSDPQFLIDNEGYLSPLDRPEENTVATEQSNLSEVLVLSTALVAPNKESVQWAVQTLYKGQKFISNWDDALSSLADTPAYVNLQVRAALFLHRSTMNYMKQFKFKLMRSYMFLFDVMVQNGGFYNQNIVDYNNWVKKNPSATELQRANKLMQIRVASANPLYQSDVLSRKSSLLDDRGFVHGQMRYPSREMCYNPNYLLYK